MDQYWKLEQIKESVKGKKLAERNVVFQRLRKDPALAAFLGFAITGAGRIYATGKGWGKLALLWILSLGLWILMLGWIVWIYSAWDGYKAAQEYNEALMEALEI